MKTSHTISKPFSIRVKAMGWLFVLVMISGVSNAQETVFSLFRSEARQANQYYVTKHFRKALAAYLDLTTKTQGDTYYLQIARSYYHLNQPREAATWYSKFWEAQPELPSKDLLMYAEALSATKQYDKSVQFYTKYLDLNPDDAVSAKKIWQLKNREYLFEDSANYTLRRLSANSDRSDLSATVYKNGLVFISNRERQTVISKKDENQRSFYRLYYSAMSEDTLANELVKKYDEPALFAKSLSTGFHQGPVCFYNDHQKMIYTSTGIGPGDENGKRTLQLFFAQWENDTWVTSSSFVYNSKSYSITAPTLNNDATVLYFSSDMPGGIGGMDLYKSVFTGGQWSKPVNLGESINTTGDESFPYVYGDNLYFASTGHAGLGGLDIFSSRILKNSFAEVQNMGYPINTNFDDFAISLTDNGTQGYFTSNRENGNDDIYEVSIDLQSYPFMITGILRYKEENWPDSAEPQILPNAKLFLIDNLKNTVVQTSTSGSTGEFSLNIPYFSQYRIKVQGNREGDQAFVSLELSKKKNSDGKYDIVVVKSVFKKGME